MAWPTDAEETRATGVVIDEADQSLQQYTSKKTLAHPRFYAYIEKPDGSKVYIGRGLNLDCDWDYGMEPVPEAGVLGPQEFVPTTNIIGLRAQVFRVMGTSLEKMGFRTPDAHRKILHSITMTLVVKDPVTKKVIDEYRGVKLAGGSVSYRVNAIVVTNAQFRAVSASAEAVQL